MPAVPVRGATRKAYAACIGGESDTDPARRLRIGGSCDRLAVSFALETENAKRPDSPQSPTSVRASVQASHPCLRLRSMCAENRRHRDRGRPKRTRSASAGWTPGPVRVVAGQSTMRSAGARIRRWTPCAGTSKRHLGHRQRTRTLGRGNSHFAGGGSGAGAVTLRKMKG